MYSSTHLRFTHCNNLLENLNAFIEELCSDTLVTFYEYLECI